MSAAATTERPSDERFAAFGEKVRSSIDGAAGVLIGERRGRTGRLLAKVRWGRDYASSDCLYANIAPWSN